MKAQKTKGAQVQRKITGFMANCTGDMAPAKSQHDNPVRHETENPEDVSPTSLHNSRHQCSTEHPAANDGDDEVFVDASEKDCQ